MVGATLLMFLLFSTYNFAQYLVLKHWMLNQEQDELQVMMSQIQSYLKAQSPTTEDMLKSPDVNSYMLNILGKNQMIRLIGSDGEEILQVNSDFDPTWIPTLSTTKAYLQNTMHNDDHILVYRAPYMLQKGTGTVEIATNLETFDHFNRTLLWVMMFGGLFAVFISAVSGWAIANQFLRPIKALTSTIKNVKEKGLQERVENIENGDELSQLARLFNDLMSQLEISFRQQTQFVDDASHELRTPITILEGHLNLLNRWGKSNQAVLDESLAASLQEVRRLKGLVQGLLALTRAESTALTENMELIRVESYLIEVLDRIKSLYPEFSFRMETFGTDSMLRINPIHFEQILLIVIDNAVKYSADQRKIDIQCHEENNVVCISIQDYGMGIPSIEIQHVFDRFYRVDRARSREIDGTGLGLAIAKNLIHHYQGEISLVSAEDEGTCVKLKFPVIKMNTKK